MCHRKQYDVLCTGPGGGFVSPVGRKVSSVSEYAYAILFSHICSYCFAVGAVVIVFYNITNELLIL